MRHLRSNRTLSSLFAGALALGALGCTHDYGAPPPPPPPAYGPPPVVQLADRNGFETGRSDGARDAQNGYPFHARGTRAYHDTPGYDPHLGPFDVYRNSFRNAYLRGYDRGFYNR